MNNYTQEVYKEEIKELKNRIDDLESRIKKDKKEEDKKEWKDGGIYYYVDANGDVDNQTWVNDSVDKAHLKIDNIFKTRSEAEDHRLRLESLTKQTAVKGEDFYVWDFDDRIVRNYSQYRWGKYNMDIKHKTKEQAEEWGKKYDKVWRER